MSKASLQCCMSLVILAGWALGANDSWAEPWLPNGCRDVPRDGIDTYVGTIQCTSPPVNINYDHYFMPGVEVGDWRKKPTPDDAIWEKRVKRDGVPAIYGVRKGSCPSKQQEAYVHLPTVGPASFRACIRTRAEAKFVHEIGLAYRVKPVPGGTLRR